MILHYYRQIIPLAVLTLTATLCAETENPEEDWESEFEQLEREWEEMEREWEALLETQTPVWIPLFSLQSGLGYSDNVLRSGVSREDSHFLHAGIDFTLWKDPRAEGPDYRLFILAESRHYFENSNLQDDYLVTLNGRGVYEIAPDWSAVLPVRIDYNEEYVDVSTREVDLGTIRFRGFGIASDPGLRYDISDNDRIKGNIAIKRQFFRDPLDHYWETGLGLGWEHGRTSDTTLTVRGRALQRRYDSREARDEDGMVLDGSRLEISIYHFDSTLNHYWDENRRWRSRINGGIEINRDNGGGYFDFIRPHLGHRLIFRSRPWRAEAGLRASHYQFDTRRTLNDQSRLNRTLVTGELRGEVEVSANLSIFSEYRHENVQTNEIDGRYRVNTVLAGMEWVF